VFLQRVSGGPPIKVTNLTDLGIVRGKRTVEGDSLIVARGVAQTDAYLVSNFQLVVRILRTVRERSNRSACAQANNERPIREQSKRPERSERFERYGVLLIINMRCFLLL